ncbi:ETX/MTX2 family pore-forming toxin [Paenibacillus sp. UMB4589-SE434]|uniref:ETX/MTX2 family pore-forming toxin n=1 Tax=Paenibacillus sp. UMB4589-SE434 TaxID=3046314 RepID=UPI00254F47E3|nr:ETX/MTX2 family pore-forming toxin [Paenibacillus sp. UMB4589-SE434]MDK8182591.1 ETX/MTX2 family pore-forming toxin [Paenibacillus sp. UMB4589-SE434]
MKKLLSLLLVSTMSVVLLAGMASPTVKAEEQRNNAVVSISNKIDTMLKSDPSWGNYFVKHTVEESILQGSNIEGTTVSNVETLTVGDSFLTNHTAQEQTLTSSSFEYEFLETTSTTNTTGWTFGYEYNASLSVLVATASHTFRVDYNMSTSQTKEKSITRTLIVPPQNVIVPAGKTYRVNYVFDKLKVSGRNTLLADIFGLSFYSIFWDSPESIGIALNYASDKQGLIRVEREDRPIFDKLRYGVRAEGEGRFSTEYGTRLYVTVDDVTNPSKPIPVETRIVNNTAPNRWSQIKPIY